jgi:hypothetical protein
MTKEEDELFEKRSKVGKSNSRRGKTFERRVAKLLTEWSGTEFRRRRVEGRDSTIVDRESTSDVIPASYDIPFSIEAKCGAGFTMNSMLMNPTNGIFTKWWGQVSYDAMILEKSRGYLVYPWLFFKPHTNYEWIAMPRSGLLKLTNHINFPHFIYHAYDTIDTIEIDISHSKKNKVVVDMKLPTPILMRWDDFRENVKSDLLKLNNV